MKEIIKTLIGILTSPEVIRIFDQDGNGVISWSELKESSTKDRWKAASIVGGDLVMKYGWRYSH